jgi:hypothetical protein
MLVFGCSAEEANCFSIFSGADFMRRPFDAPNASRASKSLVFWRYHVPKSTLPIRKPPSLCRQSGSCFMAGDWFLTRVTSACRLLDAKDFSSICPSILQLAVPAAGKKWTLSKAWRFALVLSILSPPSTSRLHSHLLTPLGDVKAYDCRLLRLLLPTRGFCLVEISG